MKLVFFIGVFGLFITISTRHVGVDERFQLPEQEQQEQQQTPGNNNAPLAAMQSTSSTSNADAEMLQQLQTQLAKMQAKIVELEEAKAKHQTVLETQASATVVPVNKSVDLLRESIQSLQETVKQMTEAQLKIAKQQQQISQDAEQFREHQAKLIAELRGNRLETEDLKQAVFSLQKKLKAQLQSSHLVNLQQHAADIDHEMRLLRSTLAVNVDSREGVLQYIKAHDEPQSLITKLKIGLRVINDVLELQRWHKTQYANKMAEFKSKLLLLEKSFKQQFEAVGGLKADAIHMDDFRRLIDMASYIISSMSKLRQQLEKQM